MVPQQELQVSFSPPLRTPLALRRRRGPLPAPCHLRGRSTGLGADCCSPATPVDVQHRVKDEGARQQCMLARGLNSTPAAACTDMHRSYMPASALSDSSTTNTSAASRWSARTTTKSPCDATHVVVATAPTSPLFLCLIYRQARWVYDAVM